MGILNDGSLKYDHEKDGFEQKFGGCQSKYRNINGPARAKITYVHETLTVRPTAYGFFVSWSFSNEAIHFRWRWTFRGVREITPYALVNPR